MQCIQVLNLKSFAPFNNKHYIRWTTHEKHAKVFAYFVTHQLQSIVKCFLVSAQYFSKVKKKNLTSIKNDFNC